MDNSFELHIITINACNACDELDMIITEIVLRYLRKFLTMQIQTKYTIEIEIYFAAFFSPLARIQSISKIGYSERVGSDQKVNNNKTSSMACVMFVGGRCIII